MSTANSKEAKHTEIHKTIRSIVAKKSKLRAAIDAIVADLEGEGE